MRASYDLSDDVLFPQESSAQLRLPGIEPDDWVIINEIAIHKLTQRISVSDVGGIAPPEFRVDLGGVYSADSSSPPGNVARINVTPVVGILSAGITYIYYASEYRLLVDRVMWSSGIYLFVLRPFGFTVEAELMIDYEPASPSDLVQTKVAWGAVF